MTQGFAQAAFTPGPNARAPSNTIASQLVDLLDRLSTARNMAASVQAKLRLEPQSTGEEPKPDSSLAGQLSRAHIYIGEINARLEYILKELGV